MLLKAESLWLSRCAGRGGAGLRLVPKFDSDRRVFREVADGLLECVNVGPAPLPGGWFSVWGWVLGCERREGAWDRDVVPVRVAAARSEVEDFCFGE